MKATAIGILLFYVSGQTWADEACHVMIPKEKLVKKTVDGAEVYVVATDAFMFADCFQPKKTVEYINGLKQKLQDVTALAEAAAKNSEKQQFLLQEYGKLVSQHEKTLDKSIEASKGFAENTKNYAKLMQDYDNLAVKFDLLAGKYRDVATTAGSIFRVDLGGGVSSGGGVQGMVGLGINVYRQWGAGVWALAGRDQQSVLGGASFRF